MGAEGPYDDLELTVTGAQMQITKAAFVPVSCFEMGGAFRSALSFELFDAADPWTIGTDGLVAKQGIAVNQLVGGGARTINYKVTGSSQQPGLVTGTLGMSFSDSKYDIFTNTITFINCAGSQSFEAVPGGLAGPQRATTTAARLTLGRRSTELWASCRLRGLRSVETPVNHGQKRALRPRLAAVPPMWRRRAARRDALAPRRGLQVASRSLLHGLPRRASRARGAAGLSRTVHDPHQYSSSAPPTAIRLSG